MIHTYRLARCFVQFIYQVLHLIATDFMKAGIFFQAGITLLNVLSIHSIIKEILQSIHHHLSDLVRISYMNPRKVLVLDIHGI